MGVAEWSVGALLFAEFWNKKLGILGALGSCFSLLATITIIPFMPNGWGASAGGFPAMTGNVAFFMKDVALLAVSVYLLRQDVLRVTQSVEAGQRNALRAGKKHPFKHRKNICGALIKDLE